jgi:hypothetical protein
MVVIASSRDFKIFIPVFVEGRANRKPSQFIFESFPPPQCSMWAVIAVIRKEKRRNQCHRE